MEIRDPKLDDVPTLTMAVLCVLGFALITFRAAKGTPATILKRLRRKRTSLDHMTPEQRASYLLAANIKEHTK